LELGTGSGIFLSKLFPKLSENNIYICIDHDINKLQYAKENIEKNYTATNFIFICCDFLAIPFKDGIIDIVIDYLGTSNYNFNKEGYLVDKIQDKVKRGGIWIGDYLSFRPDAKSLQQYPANNRKYFYRENIAASFEESRFRTIEMKDMGFTEKGGINEKFFIEGDKLYDLVYYGEKVE
jgi:hypothetical protein